MDIERWSRESGPQEQERLNADALFTVRPTAPTKSRFLAPLRFARHDMWP